MHVRDITLPEVVSENLGHMVKAGLAGRVSTVTSYMLTMISTFMILSATNKVSSFGVLRPSTLPILMILAGSRELAAASRSGVTS